MNLFFEILVAFGLPVASATVMGIFIYMILKYILESVVGQVKGIHGIIMSLDNRLTYISRLKIETRRRKNI